MGIDPHPVMFPPNNPKLRAVADAICFALACWMDEPMHLMAYEDAARAAISEMKKQQDHEQRSDEIEKLRAENRMLHDTKRWNIKPDGSDLLICTGDHHRSADCEFHRYRFIE